MDIKDRYILTRRYANNSVDDVDYDTLAEAIEAAMAVAANGVDVTLERTTVIGSWKNGIRQ